MAQSSPTSMQIYKRLLGYGAQYWPLFLLASLGMALHAATVAGMVMTVEPLIDGTFIDRNATTIKWMPWIILAIFIARGIAGFISTYTMEWIGRKVVTNMRHELFDQLLNLPAQFYDHSSAGVLLAKLTYNTEQVSESATKAVTIMIRDTLTLLALLGWMIYMSPALSLFVLVVGPPVAILIRFASKRFRKYSERIQDSMGDVTQAAEEAISGHRVVKVFDGKDFESRNFSVVNEKNRVAFMKQVAVKAISVPFIQLIAAVGLAGIIYFATRPDTNLTPGQFSSFIGAMLLLMDPLKRITDINSVLQRGIAAATSIFSVLDEEREPQGGALRLDDINGAIVFDGVSFSYGGNGEKVLSNVNFNINPGHTVAFVGRSGSGKTTLVNLLPRFYELSGGTIYLDGKNIQDYDLHNLRSHLALVSQDITLFNDSIRNNIAYGGLRGTDDKQIEEVARTAHVMDFVDKMPLGLDTLVGDKGVLLSGGQRQRIAIARALLKNAPVLILDEATSSLDSQSEKIIQAALDELMRNRTTLVIAHRLATVENADRIIVMDEGRIIETGTHRELLEAGGLYAGLYRMQFSEAESVQV